MAHIETMYYNRHGDKRRGSSHPMEDLGKFFYDAIKELQQGEMCTRETLLIDYRNAGGNQNDNKALFVIDSRLATYSLANTHSRGNGMVEKFLIGPDRLGAYTRI